MFCAGLSGSILSIILISAINRLKFFGKEFLIKIGAYTFSIYMLQQLFVQAIEQLDLKITNTFAILIISILILILCVAIIGILNRFRHSRILLLDKAY